MFFNIAVRLATLFKRNSNTGVFLRNLQNFLKHLFLQNTSTLVAASGSKLCKPMKIYTEVKVYAAEKEIKYLNGTFKVSNSR